MPSFSTAFGDLITVPGDGDTTVADLVGEYTQTPDGRYVFVHGPLVRAMPVGRPLFIDDATLIPPTVLAVENPRGGRRRHGSGPFALSGERTSRRVGDSRAHRPSNPAPNGD